MTRVAWMAVALGLIAVRPVAPQSETTVTVTGCVQNISSTTPAGETTHGFLLSNATPADAAADAGTRRRPPSIATASFLLDGRDGELKSQVGHKVEITGTVDAPVETAVEPRAAASLTSGPGAKSMDRQQRLHVSAVKMVASNCQSK